MPWHVVFFYLTVLLIPTQLGFHSWPDWSFILGRRIDYLSPTLYLTDITIFITLLLWICYPQKNPLKKIWHHRCFLFIFLLLGLFVVENIGVSLSPFAALYKWMKVVEYVLLGVYIYKTKPNIHTTIFIISIAVVYSSILAIVQFYLQHSIGGILWVLGERSFTIDTPGIARMNWCNFSHVQCHELLRPYATFSHPNVLGGFLATVLPIILFGFIQTYKQLQAPKKIFFAVSISIGIFALALSFSRSAWVAGVIGMFATSVLLRKTKSFIWIMMGAVATGVGLVSLPYVQMLIEPNESVQLRLHLADAAIKMWRSYPLFGVGANNYLVRLPQVLQLRDLYFLQPVHNIYLLLLSETGIVGFFLFGYLLFLSFSKKILQTDIWSISLAVLLFLGFMDHYPLTIQQGQLLFVFVLSYSFTKNYK